MSREAKTQRLRQQTFITQLLLQGFLSAATPALATRRLRRMLAFWCGHDYRMALAACAVAAKLGARPLLGRAERMALFRQGDRRLSLASRIAHRVLAAAGGTADAAAALGDGEHPGVVAWAAAAAVGAADGAADGSPPAGLDDGDMQAVVEHAARLLALFGRPAHGERLLDAWAALEQARRDRSGTMVLAPLYRANIGHQAIVAALLQACRDGVFAQRRVHLLPGRPHNPFLVSLLEPLLAPAPGAAGFVEPISGGKVYRTAAGELLSVTDLMSRAADRWRETGPPLRLDAEIRRRGDAALAALGIAPDAPVVSLHVREPGWHAAHGEVGNIRDAVIATYAPAVAWLAGRGCRVIRLGDPSMTPLPDGMPALDYARSPLKSDWMDVYIAARCRFHVGTASGMSFVPLLFGRPVLFTNYAPLDHVLDPRSVVTLFKLPRDMQGRVVPPAVLAGRVRHAISFADLEAAGAWLEDNDPDDILDAVRFVDAHVDGAGGLRFPAGTFASSDAAFAQAGWHKRPQMPPRFWARYYGGAAV